MLYALIDLYACMYVYTLLLTESVLVHDINYCKSTFLILLLVQIYTTMTSAKLHKNKIICDYRSLNSEIIY